MEKQSHDRSEHVDIHEPNHLTRKHSSENDDKRTLKPEDYTVAWVAALPIEVAAAYTMLDEEHTTLRGTGMDNNSYSLGSISGHDVVIACLSNLQYGNNQATLVVSSLKTTFPSIQHCLMVGIGGGVPHTVDIRLGDVVVGTRVMQYDLGKTGPEGFERTAVWKMPSQLLATTLSTLRARHELGSCELPVILEERLKQYPRFQRPDVEDWLYEADYPHQSQIAGCNNCDSSRLLPRRRRDNKTPEIHYGAIASGNQVMKDGVERDTVGRELGVLCFDMESAGVTEVIPCLPIRGISDYSDSHKSDYWQRYAAAAAAAYAREFLETLAVVEASHSKNDTKKADATKTHRQDFLKSLEFDTLDFRRSDIKQAHTKTCHWMMQVPQYETWLNPTDNLQRRGFFWIKGKPGSGKSTMMKYLYNRLRKSTKSDNQQLVASFFFHAGGKSLGKSVSGMYRSLLLQLLHHFKDIQSVIDDVDTISKSSGKCPHLNVLKDMFFQSVLLLGKRKLTCFVDALDESDEQQVTEMVRDFEDLSEECHSAQIDLRICFSSRPYPYIYMRDTTPFVLERHPGHIADMETFARSRLQIGDLGEDLIPDIITKSGGIFLWVVLVVQILNDDYKRGGLSIRRKLRDTPKELSELFRNMLLRDDRSKRQLCISLIWVLLAFEPLEPKAFCHAVWAGRKHYGDADNEPPSIEALGTGEQVSNLVTGSSKGLIEIAGGSTGSDGIYNQNQKTFVQFIHESVRDFLVKDRGLQSLWADLGPSWAEQGHDRLKNYCRQYLALPELKQGVRANMRSTILPKYPFVDYASGYMLPHAEKASHAVEQAPWLEDLWSCRWLPILKLCELFHGDYTAHETPLNVLCKRGLSNLVRVHLRREPMVANDRGPFLHPLITAFESGRHEVVAAILGLHSTIVDGIDICARAKDNAYARHGRYDSGPLTWAISCRNYPLLVGIQESGLPCTLQDQRDALRFAIKNNEMHLIHFVPQLLRSPSKWTASYYLADAIVRSRRFLERDCRRSGANVNFLNSLGRTPLMQLICENDGCLTLNENLKRLIDETDLDVVDCNGHTVRVFQEGPRLVIRNPS